MTDQSDDAAIRDLLRRAYESDTEEVAIDLAESLADIRRRATSVQNVYAGVEASAAAVARSVAPGSAVDDAGGTVTSKLPTRMSVPTIHPDQRDPADVEPTENYRPADPVWFYRDGVWRSALIEAVSEFTATVIYRSARSRRTDVDIRTARYVLARKEFDPLLDLDTEILNHVGGAQGS